MDDKERKRRENIVFLGWILAFASGGSFGVGLGFLPLLRPDDSSLGYGLFCVVLAIIGGYLSLVFIEKVRKLLGLPSKQDRRNPVEPSRTHRED